MKENRGTTGRQWAAILTIFVFSIILVDLAESSICESQFNPAKHQALVDRAIKKIEKVNPALLSEISLENTSLTELYIVVKNESWRINPRGMIPWKNRPEISDELKTQMQNNAPKGHDLSDFNDGRAYEYYGNLLQGLMVFLENTLRTQFTETYLGSSDSKKLKEFLENVFDESNFPGLADRSLDPERAQEILLKTHSEQNWSLITMIGTRHIEAGVIEQDSMMWIREQVAQLNMPESTARLIQAGFKEKERKFQYCCVNNPGCSFCPNNRGFLKSR